MVRVLVVGHVNWDVTLQVDALPEPDGESRIESTRSGGGGSAANTALALAGLGVETRLVGSVGDDDYGRRARDDLAAAGVDLSDLAVVAGATTVKYVLAAANGEVAILGSEGVNEALGPDDIDPAVVREVDHVHLTSHRPDVLAFLARTAREAGVTVSFDPGRRIAHRDYETPLALADVVFRNDREAAVALPPADAERVVVTKHGGAGATVDAPGATCDHPGFDVDAVDTNGAGDAFAAGFLSAWLDGATRSRALAVGNACGALTAERVGARADLDRPAVDALARSGSSPSESDGEDD